MKNNFKQWACSFSGCDGGNLDAKIWLCGIEWGGGSTEGYYQETLPKQIESGYVENPIDYYDWEDSLTTRYGISFAKLYSAISGGEVDEYAKVKELSGREILKLNLYPIAFDSTNSQLWDAYGLKSITGFSSKHLFKIWCFFNRFPYFTKLRKQKRPKIIVCTGIDYLKDFTMFFGGGSEIEGIETGYIKAKSDSNQYDRQYYWQKLDEETVLIVIPFFSGRYGLNSNFLLQEMGKRIRELVPDL